MGLDGGTIPTRCELVKTKKKDVKVFDKDQVDYGKWFLCALAQNKLCEPIVIDDLGNLFNKDNVLEAILNGTLENSKNFSHIRSLRSIYPVNFSKNPAFKDDDNDDKISPWLCPITKLEVGSSNYKFKFIKTCGHVLSEKSFKELSSSSTENSTTESQPQLSCFLCSKEYNIMDLITINPVDEELEQMKLSLKEKLASKKKSSKKSNKKRSLESNLTSESSFTSNTLAKTNEEISKKMKSETFSSIFKSSSSSSSSSTTTTTSSSDKK